MSAKAPSAGTKVTAGKNAPVTSEGHGVVAQDSLAAESQSFQQANQTAPQQVGREDLTSAPKPHEGGIHQKASSGSAFATKPTQGDHNGAAAPSYVQSQSLKDPSGPHGKNLTEDEGIATEDKSKNTSFSKQGTADDPGRAAAEQFNRANTANAGSAGGREKGIDNEQPYGALGSDVQA
ncbi:dihydroxy-acid dehydratase ilv3 [Hypoxylon texense]